MISLSFVFLLSLVHFLSPHSAYAASSASNTVNISVNAGCIISASGNTHTGSIAPSTYAQIGGEGSNTTVTIGCNDGNGYTVYAVGYGNDEEGVNTLTGKKASNTIATGTAQSGDTSNWNFKLSDPTGLTLTSAYTNNSDVPDSSTAVATKKASTDPTGYIDSFKASYFAYISSTQPADTYSGKVKYTVFHNTELIYNYTIHYDLDSGSGGPTPNPQTGTSNTGSVKLSGTEPTKDSHKFMGWCSVQPTGNNTDNPTCSGQTYTAGQDYPLGEIDTDTTLYAIWKQDKEELLTSIVTVDSNVTQITFKVGSGIEMIMVGDPTKDSTNYWRPSYGFSGADIVMPVTGGEKILVSVTPKANYKLGSWTKTTGNTQTWTANGVEGTYDKMKDVTHAACIAAGEEGMNVTDERNGVSYTIGKWESRCWMLSNLRLEPGTVLNSTTSAVSSDFTLPTQADSDAWTSSSQNYYSKKNMKVCKGTTGYTSSGAGNKCADQTTRVTEYYYNWYAAIANDAVGSTPTSNTSATTALDGQSKGSICPKNWHLVVINDWGDVDDTIVKAWNADKAGNPGRLVSSGSFNSGAQYAVGSYGDWWSSSRNGDSEARYVNLDTGSANSVSTRKSSGYSVRCEL